MANVSNSIEVCTEDDAVLAGDLKYKLEGLKIVEGLAKQTGLVLLGWNTDSLLQAELLPGLEMIGLFEQSIQDWNK